MSPPSPHARAQAAARPSSDRRRDLRAALAEHAGRVALAHDWVVHPGGSEKVVEAILGLVPQAELYTSVYDPDAWQGTPIADREVHTSFLQGLPGATARYPKLLPLMDRAFRSFDLSGADLVISSSHASAKNVRVPDGVPHVCYCHTPMRYAWDPSFLEGEQLGPVARAAFAALLPRLRAKDLRGAAGPTRFVANSTFVAERIRTHYGREADVVHPPVDVDRFLRHERRVADDAPYLFFGRLVPYKKADQAIAACNRLGRKLVVAGTGRDVDRLKAMADPAYVEFVGRVDDDEVASLFATSRALLFPGLEDFGIVPVEAQAAGLPVIGLGAGGLRDTVVDGVTGVLYDEPSVNGLARALRVFEQGTFDDTDVRRNALRFSAATFGERFGRVLLEAAEGGPGATAARARRPVGSRRFDPVSA